MTSARNEPRIATGTERETVLYRWNDTRRALPDACVHRLFERQVERTPDAVAVVFGERRLTYRELDARANQVAHFLRARAVGPESLVGVCMRRGPELVIALLGVWKAGGAYVPLDPAYPVERLSFMVRDAAVSLVLSDRRSADLLSTAAVSTACLDGDDASAIAREPTEAPVVAVGPSNLAYVMYTSGSTGQPKGAMILHHGLVNYLTWAIEAYGVEAGGSVPVHSSIAFDLTVTSLYPPLLAGGKVELLPEDVGALSLLAALRRSKDHHVVKITPAHLDALSRQLRPEEMSGMARVFVIGGENLPAESLDPWRDFAPRTRLMNEYVPSETVVGCCVHEVRGADPRSGPVPIGRPIANTELYVLDEALQPVPIGTMGELYIGGAGVARGYLNRPELTRERFLPDPFSGRVGARIYRTGDLARHRPDGTLEFLGRLDNQVKVRGYRIELGEIEAALAGHPAVQSCAVIAREDTPGNKQLVGYLVGRSDERPRPDEVQAFLKGRLPEHMVPAHLVLLDALPLTQNGKVDRGALAAPSYANVQVVGDAFTPPRDATEVAVANIWRELLRVDRVGLEADFFDLGGQSLLAIRALARIRDELGVDLPPQTLFDHSTLAALAAQINEARRAPAAPDAAPIPALEPGGPVPASFAQEQLWLLDRMAPGSAAYHVVDVVPLAGRFDGPALRRALGELVIRHQVLRTTFSYDEGRLSQKIAPPFEPTLDAEIDLGSLSEAEARAAWSALVHEEGRRLFDLSKGPLLRTSVAHVSKDEHRLLLVVHHILADEWSMEIVQRELPALYAASCAGRPSPLAPLPIQYAAYAAWQRESLQGEALQSQIAYWKSELAGAVGVLDLPTDKPRPQTPSQLGAMESFQVPGALLDRLHALCRHEHTTLFMLLEATFAALLHRYTGQEDLLVGTPISNRTRPETHGLIGYFLNTVVLRARFEGDPSFRSLLRQVRARALGAYGHADLPFARLVAEVAPERDPARSPLVQAMFIHHASDGISQVSKVSGNRELGTGTAKFDLTLVVSESAGGLEGLFEYASDLFEGETVRRLCRSYCKLLEAVADDPDRNVSRLAMLAEADQRELLACSEGRAVDFADGARALHELFEQQAARTPDRPALVFAGETWTYGQLERKSNALARRLTALGVGPDVTVGLLVERSLDMVLGLIAILKAGGAYLPLDPSFPAARLDYVLEDSRAPVLVSHRGLDRALKVRPSAVVDLDAADGDHSGGEPSARSPVEPGNLAYVLYTSGSTGKPKGVAIPHSAIVNFLLSMQREPGLDASDTLLAVTTLSFDIAGLELLLPLVCGAKVVIASREDAIDPHRLMDRLRDHACTVMQATPATWRALLDAGWSGSPGLKALCGGEAMPPALARALLRRCRELWNMYGPTETTVWSTLHRMEESGAAAPPIGRPIANTQAYVLDAHGDLAAPGAVGELYLGGHGLARGYLRRDELTRERFVPSPFSQGARLYRTGDRARWRWDGRLECLGRTDHQVKLRGYRIELGEIEACIAGHPRVREAVVIARETAPGDKRLVAYLVSGDAPGDLVDELRARLRAALPEYMVPAHFVCLEAMPLTPNGKVDRAALPAPTTADVAPRSDTYVAPRNELEASVAAAWERVLGVERVGVHDDFFDLGGDSLKVLKLIVEIEHFTGTAVDLSAIFRNRTVATFVESLGSTGARDASLVVPLQPLGAGRPVFCLCGITLYQEFARSLGDAQPVLGVYVPEEQSLTRQALQGARVEVSITRLAKAYYDAIRRASPQGPFRLAGSSLGGIVALEVASMMRKDGAEVEFVALLDTLSPRGIRRNWVKWFWQRSRQLVRGEAPAKILRELLRFRDRLVARGWLPGARNPALAANDAYELKLSAYFAAIASWQARSFVADFRVVLFRARDQAWGPQDELDPDYGWRHYLSGPLTVIDLSGDHLGILKSPHVAELGRKVQDYLSPSKSAG